MPSNAEHISSTLKTRVGWVVKEQQRGLWVPVHSFKNLLTTYGLTAFASAPSGQYTPPIYLAIDTASTTMYITGNIGDTAIQTTGDPTITGDTQLVLSVGLPAQETATFTSKSGAGPYTFTLQSALVNAHPATDPVVRAVTTGDTISSVVSEGQYDPTFNPSGRVVQAAAFSPGVGQYTMQFFISGTTATNLFFAHVGLVDQPLIGNVLTNLHNYASLGYNHNNTNDLEIDVTWVVTAS